MGQTSTIRCGCLWEKWDLCNFAINEEELKERVCYGGLDLSSTTDITAFVLVFSSIDEDKYQILPLLFVTRR